MFICLENKEIWVFAFLVTELKTFHEEQQKISQLLNTILTEDSLLKLPSLYLTVDVMIELVLSL